MVLLHSIQQLYIELLRYLYKQEVFQEKKLKTSGQLGETLHICSSEKNKLCILRVCVRRRRGSSDSSCNAKKLMWEPTGKTFSRYSNSDLLSQTETEDSCKDLRTHCTDRQERSVTKDSLKGSSHTEVRWQRQELEGNTMMINSKALGAEETVQKSRA